jgi:hypothetical protein
MKNVIRPDPDLLKEQEVLEAQLRRIEGEIEADTKKRAEQAKKVIEAEAHSWIEENIVRKIVGRKP